MNYRAARDIAQDRDAGRTTTEHLRQAMVHFRALFTSDFRKRWTDIQASFFDRLLTI
jgi:hypothetical protein